MNSSAGQNHPRLSARRCKDGVCGKCGCPSGDQVKFKDVLINRLEKTQRLGKYIDFFVAMLTAMKKLNGDVLQVSESEISDSLNMVDHLKGLFCKLDEASRSGLPAADSSGLQRRHREFMEIFSHLDKVVGRIERLFSRKTVRNLTELLDGCQKNLLGFQVGLKETRYMEHLERRMVDLKKSNDNLFHISETAIDLNKTCLEEEKNLKRKYDSVCNRLESLENLLIKIMKKEYLRKRRNSW